MINLTKIERKLALADARRDDDTLFNALYRCVECKAYHTIESVPVPPEEATAHVLAGRPVFDSLCCDACLEAAQHNDEYEVDGDEE
jgi:hypothetical protein